MEGWEQGGPGEGKGHEEEGGQSYSLTEVAEYLASLGDEEVLTDAGPMPAKKAARLVAAGALKEVFVLSTGAVIRIEGFRAYSTVSLTAGRGRGVSEFVVSPAEIVATKMADFLMSLGLRPENISKSMMKDPIGTAATVLQAYERAWRASRAFEELRTDLLQFLDIVADVVTAKAEGNIFDRTKRFWKAGEFHGLEEHVKHRLHVTRSLQRILQGNLRPIYKVFTEIGRHYIIVFDKSGSMGAGVRFRARGSETLISKKAVGAVTALAIAKADPEARYTLVIFDSAPTTIAVSAGPEDIAGAIIDVTAGGGTDYTRALLQAIKYAEGDDVLVVVGDFLDSPPPVWVGEKVIEKTGKRVLIPVLASETVVERFAQVLNADVFWWLGSPS